MLFVTFKNNFVQPLQRGASRKKFKIFFLFKLNHNTFTEGRRGLVRLV